MLNGAGFATLLFDPLTPREERNRANVFDIDLLASRLVDVTGWLAVQPDTASPPVGYFGASTGVGAALRTVVDPRVKVQAIVSRGGRPDLAGQSLTNRRAQAAIRGDCRLAVVPGATHLFEEPGTLDQVAALARDWFIEHLNPGAGQ